MKRLLALAFILLPAVVWARTNVVIRNDFANAPFGWQPGLSDFSGKPADYEFKALYGPRPANLGGSKALVMASHNRSDDLFMFWVRPIPRTEDNPEDMRRHGRIRVRELAPNTTYDVTFTIEFASKYPAGGFGIGGSPGDSVFLKAGVVTREPRVVQKDGFWEMNIDKGAQSKGGKDMIVLGTIAKPDDGTEKYVLVSRSNQKRPFRFRTGPTGRAWLVFGTDSGFEGLTRLYYTSFTATFRPVGRLPASTPRPARR